MPLHCESSLQVSSIVNVLVTQFRCKIAIKRLSKLNAYTCVAQYLLKRRQFPNENNFNTKAPVTRYWIRIGANQFYCFEVNLTLKIMII
jgi:hypothetical protein